MGAGAWEKTYSSFCFADRTASNSGIILSHDNAAFLFKLSVFFPRRSQDREVGIGVFPQGKELLIRLAAFDAVARERRGARQP